MTTDEMIARLESVVAELKERGGGVASAGHPSIVWIINDLKDAIDGLKELDE